VDPETNEPRLYDGIVTRYEYCEDKKKYMYWIVFPEDESGLYFSEYQVSKSLTELAPSQTPKQLEDKYFGGDGLLDNGIEKH
jgi:hypothetical protein